jgi:putative protease
MNTVNHKSVLYHFGMGADEVSLSYELSPERVIGIAKKVPDEFRDALEWPVHVRMPAFHMEYCLFTMRYGNGENYPHCGQPCRKHDLYVKDSRGAVHQVLYDHLCRNTVYLERPVDHTASIQDAVRAGIRHFRIEEVVGSGKANRGILPESLLRTISF